MRAGPAWLWRTALRFSTACGGAAVVEFALIVPFLLTLYLGSMEASSLYTVDRRVTTISGTMGDLVARTDGTITTATLNDYFKASEGIIVPYSSAGLKQVVSCISVSATGVTNVMWSRGYNGGTARLTNSPYPLDTEMNNVARGGYLIASETSYSYKPLLGVVFQNAIDLYRESFYLPRFDEYIPPPS